MVNGLTDNELQLQLYVPSFGLASNRIDSINAEYLNKIFRNSSLHFPPLPFFNIRQYLMEPTFCETQFDKCNFEKFFIIDKSVITSVVQSWNFHKEEYGIQVILRLHKVEPALPKCKRLPLNLNICINDRPCKLSQLTYPMSYSEFGVRDNIPINLSEYIIHSQKVSLKMTWSEEPWKFIACIVVAKKITVNDLLIELKQRPFHASKKTKKFIHESLENNDTEVGSDGSMALTLKDPISQVRMKLPARGVNCEHLQCFDAVHFLQMNEIKATWVCPLCKNDIEFPCIDIDQYFLNILQNPNLSSECDSIVILQDGTWSENVFKPIKRNQSNIEVITLSDASNNNDFHSTKSLLAETNNIKKENDLSLPSTSSAYQSIPQRLCLKRKASEKGVHVITID